MVLMKMQAMKKIIYSLFFILFFVNVLSGQTDRGTWFLGGNGSYLRFDGKGSLVLNPSIGYFLVNHLAGGIQLNLVAITSSTSWSLGPFAKYYFYGDERGRYYASIGLNIGSGAGSDFDAGYSFGAGYAKFLNSSISIEFGAQYLRTGSSGGIFSLGAGFQIHFNRLRD